jgi:hypothetical protein
MTSLEIKSLLSPDVSRNSDDERIENCSNEELIPEYRDTEKKIKTAMDSLNEPNVDQSIVKADEFLAYCLTLLYKLQKEFEKRGINLPSKLE